MFDATSAGTSFALRQSQMPCVESILCLDTEGRGRLSIRGFTFGAVVVCLYVRDVAGKGWLVGRAEGRWLLSWCGVRGTLGRVAGVAQPLWQRSQGRPHVFGSHGRRE